MGLFVLFLNRGSVGKQSGVSGAVRRARTPHSGSMTTACFVAACWAVGSGTLDGDNGGSVEMLLLSSGRMHFN